MEKELKGGTENLPVQRKEEPDTGANGDTGVQKWYAVRSSKVMITFPVEEDSCPDEDETGPEENKTGLDIPDGQDPSPQPQLYSEQGETADAPQDSLLFYGAVREEHNKAAEGVAVMVFACCKDHTERFLGYTISGSEGNYLINIPDLSDYKDITGFIVRAGGTTREHQKAHGSPTGYEREKNPDSPNKNFHSFLRFIYDNPNKSLHELAKGF
ncbi:MAG: hypothetical protein M1543_01275 [Firmicutes bacterium]|nr:hypothetical protein [Bacillota bacterium]